MSDALSADLLGIRGLRKSFRGRPVLRGLDFDVAGGWIVGLVGVNGAGKSTTMNCLSGRLQPDGGSISAVVDGRAIALRSGILLVPETPVVYAELTVWDHLSFIALARSLPRGWQTEATALIERFSLGAYTDTLGSDLSKGTRQKLLLACGILSGTRFLLLDEPLIGLDPSAQEELVTILRELRLLGRAIVMSTHVLEFAARLCDRVVVIRDGVATVIKRDLGVAELRVDEISRALDIARC